jgi:hypothetical protein
MGGRKAGASSFLNSLYVILSAIAVATTTSGCRLQTAAENAASSSSSTATSTAPTVVATGPRAIRIIFKQSNPSGSFDASPSNGTVPTPGSGQQAVRFFNADGSLLAGAASSWLSSFEIGISGSNNTAARNSACAKFADATESSSTDNCLFGTAGAVGCGAPNGLYRVSEYDCLATSGQVAQDGTGGPGDGIYLRATFNRSLLGTGENLMAAIEYVASAFDAAPASPTTCFSGGKPAPELCSNVTWKAFVKHSLSETVQPFLMLVPPTQNYVNTGIGTSGVSPQMRQFVVPLAGDPKLSVLQISRIHSNLDRAAAAAACNNSGTLPANSPLCAGIVIYSLTLYRI